MIATWLGMTWARATIFYGSEQGKQLLERQFGVTGPWGGCVWCFEKTKDRMNWVLGGVDGWINGRHMKKHTHTHLYSLKHTHTLKIHAIGRSPRW